jgi:hypothetical protein
MSHAIDDKKLFIDEDDISDFLSRFEKGIKKTGFKCLGWALMGTIITWLSEQTICGSASS